MNSDPIVRIDAAQGKGQGLADRLQSAPYRLLALAQHGLGLGPARVDVGQIERVAEIARSRVARMRHQVDLGEARHLDVPMIRLERDVMLQQAPRLGAAVEPAPPLPLLPAQAIIDAARADAEQLPLRLRRQPEAAANPGHPLRQQGLQTYRPGIIGRFPDGLQNRHHGRAVGSAAYSSPGRRFRRRQRTVQQADSMLAVITAVGAELVQHALLLRTAGLPVARINALQIVPSRCSTHWVTRLHDG